MYEIRLTDGGHLWRKQNLVTVVGKGKNHDIMKCALCGMKGNTSSLETIKLKGSYSEDKVNNCGGSKMFIPRRIKVRYCNAFSPSFTNIIKDSEHDVVDAPPGYKNDFTGVWIMGIGEPVKLLLDEFTVIA